MKRGHFRILLAASAAVWLSMWWQPAAACNKTAGCVLDVQLESYQMMRDGRMFQGMREGRDNIEAFQRLQAADKAAKRPPTRRK